MKLLWVRSVQISVVQQMKCSPLAWLLSLDEAAHGLAVHALHVKSHAIVLAGLVLDAQLALSAVRPLCHARVELVHGLVFEIIHGDQLDELPALSLPLPLQRKQQKRPLAQPRRVAETREGKRRIHLGSSSNPPRFGAGVISGARKSAGHYMLRVLHMEARSARREL